MAPPKQLAAHAFKKGWKAGPGRPPGMRNKLTEIALAALGDDFSKHGSTVIEEVRKTKPHIYLQVVASLLPKQMQVERTLSPLSDITDEELEQIEELLAASRAKLVQKLNGASIALESSDKNEQEK